jgi:hypothetical protein
MWNKCKAILLPTNDKSAPLILGNETILRVNGGIEDVTLDWKYQHLCIISDDEIEENVFGYYYNDEVDGIPAIGYYFKNDEFGNPTFNVNENIIVLDSHEVFESSHKRWSFKKVIASTDKLLKSDWIYKNNILPQIPQTFIQLFIKEYNKGNVITDVLVEYEEILGDEGIIKSLDNEDWELKINQDTTINIKVKKDLNYYKSNAEEDYASVPISVLRYISELEKEVEYIYNKVFE